MGKHILILGTGSVGKRHANNLQNLGCVITCMDPRQDRLDEVQSEGVALKGGWTSLEQALENGPYDGAVVASPPAFHVVQCLACLDAGIPIFLEKPVSPDLAGAMKLAEAADKSDVPLLLGYTWRWWPALLEVREQIKQGAVGEVLHVEFVMSAHLADWHPWEKYQDFFMSRAELGGGALLDESHWIDQMLWFFGMPDKLTGSVDKISDLEIDSDDNVDVLAHYGSKKVSLHLDLYGRPHEKSITFRGTKGTLRWEVDKTMVAESMEPEWTVTSYDHERNHMFVKAVEEFLGVLDGKGEPACTIHDGVAVLKVVEAVRRSSASGNAEVPE